MSYRALGTSCLLCILALPLEGQTVLSGFVREDSTGQPLPGVEVLIEGSNRRTVTAVSGKFVMSDLPRGTRVAVFRHVGWRPVRLRVELAEGDTVWAEALMVREGVHLAPITVTASAPRPSGIREEFDERRRSGFGQFLDKELLRRSEHLRLPDLLRRLRGFQLVSTASGGVVAMSSRKPGCFMQVILDGHVLHRSRSPTSQDTTGSGPPDLRREIDVSALEAVEVYRSAAETPGEFSGTGAACGTIVLWSRRH